MRNATLLWSLPTTRESGGPLAAEEIDGVELSIAVVKADGSYGAFTFARKVLPTEAQEHMFADLDFGKWVCRFVVIDTRGGRSKDALFEFVAADDTPPGIVTNIIVTLE